MNTNRWTGRAVGALFLVALFTNAIGGGLAESVVLAPDFLTSTSVHRSRVISGELLELICGAAVVGIGALTYPVFKRYSQSMAAGYLGFRITEAAVNVLIVLSTLQLLTLSQEYVRAPAPDAHLLGVLYQAERHWAQVLYVIVFGFGDAILYLLLYRSRLVPRFIAVWGLAGLALLLAGFVLDLYGHSANMLIYAIPLALNELFLGLWLLVRGFAAGAPAPVELRSDQSLVS